MKRAKRGWSLLWAARYTAKWEGYREYAYLDVIASPAVWTIAYGWTGPIKRGGVWRPIRAGDRVTRREGMMLLAKGLRDAAKSVNACIRVPLTVRQRMALISAVYNCGAGIVNGSQLQAKLNARLYRLAADELLEWVHAGGVVVQGLVNRRRDEREMFLSKMPKGAR